ncbi:ArsR/SmtB family transcription factor [Actinotalea subterranea]|uniref:ArsR/SmtB family transcription factor n=1 Tax=Actinotalea subterranea TaxID=2607497 RepID=UPI0011EC206A|nr:metalloregulator ArsR/SmtB family transcription factor [Actinotalea subterranea]
MPVHAPLAERTDPTPVTGPHAPGTSASGALGAAVGPIPAVACCAPLVRTPLTPAEATGFATVLKAIADPARLRALSLIASHEGGTACVCDLVEPLGLSQPTVSHHLKVLTDAGLLTREKRGVWAYFSLVPGALDDVARVLVGTRA